VACGRYECCRITNVENFNVNTVPEVNENSDNGLACTVVHSDPERYIK
jgi:hypothetical protein